MSAETTPPDKGQVTSMILLNPRTLIYLCSYLAQIKLVAYCLNRGVELDECTLPRPEKNMSFPEHLKLQKDAKFELYSPVPGFKQSLFSWCRERHADSDAYLVRIYELRKNTLQDLSQKKVLCKDVRKDVVRLPDGSLIKIDGQSLKELVMEKAKELLGDGKRFANCTQILETEDKYILSFFGDENIYFADRSELDRGQKKKVTITILDTSRLEKRVGLRM